MIISNTDLYNTMQYMLQPWIMAYYYIFIIALKFNSLLIKPYNTTAIYNKGKAIPLQAWTGSQSSRRLRLPDFKTTGT
jgi:hypothetical protein